VTATFDAALAAVRNVGDGPRLLEQANRIADGLEARIGTARAFLLDRGLDKPWNRATHADVMHLLDILGGTP
jgi:hypothetical protein